MADDKTTGGGNPQEGGLTVVTVPDDKAQAVLDFVASLESEEAEVSGHMISGARVGAIGGALSARGGRSLSGCSQTGGTGFGTDWQCSDVDK